MNKEEIKENHCYQCGKDFVHKCKFERNWLKNKSLFKPCCKRCANKLVNAKTSGNIFAMALSSDLEARRRITK